MGIMMRKINIHANQTREDVLYNVTLNAHITPKYRFLSLIILFTAILSFFTSPLAAQQATSPVTLTINAGFDGVFRAQAWFPVVVTARNNGAAVNGRLVIRPETSGAALNGTFSTPISLAEGATQTATIAITAGANLTQLRVELIDDQGVIVASEQANTRWIQSSDLLYAVITESSFGAVDLTGVRFSQGTTYQTTWMAAQLPDRVGMLDALNLILITDADTGRFTPAQVIALESWVASGGHLIVTGGANWQATAAGISHLLPFSAENSTQIDSLAPLADWLARSSDAPLLEQSTVITTGALREQAQTLVSAGTMPLIARHSYGDGTVDYLAVDPLSQPLRGWQNLTQVWLTLASSTSPQLSWENGVTQWDNVINITQIVPGYSPLPDILGIFLFLLAYILLISPINYIILKAINRREWAWVTIPIFVLIFTILSQAIGTNLRGNDAIVNRVSVVRSWGDVDQARVDSFIGLLSPIRNQYTLTAPDGEMLQPISRKGSLNLNLPNVEIQQTDLFRAQDFNVDASFIMPFAASSHIDRPALSGTATVSTINTTTRLQTLRGSVRNDTDAPIHHAVILARGAAIRLADVIEVGEIVPFEIELTASNITAPNRRLTLPSPTFQTYYYDSRNTEQTIRDIIPEANYLTYSHPLWGNPRGHDQTWLQRQQLLHGIMNDGNYNTGRGDGVYLAAWSDTPFTEISVEGLSSRTQDTSLYLIELTVTLDQPADTPTLVTADRFTWATLEQARSGIEFTPVNLSLQNGDQVVFRFTPLPDAILREVTTIRMYVREFNSSARNMPIEVYNWRTAQWEPFVTTSNNIVISDPSDYLGANNAVDVRIIADAIGGSVLRLGSLGVEQTGSY